MSLGNIALVIWLVMVAFLCLGWARPSIEAIGWGALITAAIMVVEALYGRLRPPAR